MKGRYAALVGLMLAGLGCGGHLNPHTPGATSDDADTIEGPRESLQMYLVLTHDPNAMQNKAAVADMWTAVRGEREGFGFINAHLKGAHLPRDYRVDIELDFARLPNSKLPRHRLAPLLAKLPNAVRERATSASLAVSIRSQSRVLAQGNHIRLVGAAALRVAERYQGVIVDLLARRSFTPADWRAELNSPGLSKRQYRWVRRRRSDGRFQLLSRGNVKYGRPDLLVGPFEGSQLKQAGRLFAEAHGRILMGGGQIGQRVVIDGVSMLYVPCDGESFDGECIALAVPR